VAPPRMVERGQSIPFVSRHACVAAGAHLRLLQKNRRIVAIPETLPVENTFRGRGARRPSGYVLMIGATVLLLDNTVVAQSRSICFRV
jgi:hypothetical protein